MHRSNSVALRQIAAGDCLPAANRCRFRGDRYHGDRSTVAEPCAFTFQKESA